MRNKLSLTVFFALSVACTVHKTVDQTAEARSFLATLYPGVTFNIRCQAPNAMMANGPCAAVMANNPNATPISLLCPGPDVEETECRLQTPPTGR